jgi:hypothetical protein
MNEQELGQMEPVLKQFVDAQNEAMNSLKTAMQEFNELIRPVMQEVLPELRELSGQFKTFVKDSAVNLSESGPTASQHKEIVRELSADMERLNGMYRGTVNENNTVHHVLEQKDKTYHIPESKFSQEVLAQIKGQDNRMSAFSLNTDGKISSVTLGDRDVVAKAPSDEKPETPTDKVESAEQTDKTKTMTKKQITAALKEKYSDKLTIAKGDKEISGECLGQERFNDKDYLIVKTKDGVQAVLVEKQELQSRIDAAVDHFVRVVFSGNKANKLSIGQQVPGTKKEAKVEAAQEKTTVSEPEQPKPNNEEIKGKANDHKSKLDEAVDNLNREINKEGGFKSRMQDASDIINMTKGLGGSGQAQAGKRGFKVPGSGAAKAAGKASTTAAKNLGSGAKKAATATIKTAEKGAAAIKSHRAKPKNNLASKFPELETLRGVFKDAMKDYSRGQKAKNEDLISTARTQIKSSLKGIFNYIEKVAPGIEKSDANHKKLFSQAFKAVKKEMGGLSKISNKYGDDRELKGISKACSEKIKQVVEKVVNTITRSLGASNKQEPKA